jgi:hypothetical protein
VRLHPHLDYPQHRNEHHQIPKPAREKVRLAFAEKESRTSNGNDEQSRERDFPKRQLISEMRIKRRQPHWPDHLPQIGQATHDRVAQSPGKSQFPNRSDRLFVRQECCHRGRRGKREQRNFFKKDPANRRWLCETAKRPVIQEQKNKRCRDEHRFGQQPQTGRGARQRGNAQQMASCARNAHNRRA